MGLLKRLLGGEEKVEDVPDYPVYEPGSRRALPDQSLVALFRHSDHEHQWVEKRVQVIRATCSDCGRTELRPDRRGRLWGQKLGAVTDEEKAKWVELYLDGRSAKVVAAEFHRGYAPVVEHLKSAGVWQ